ncbi:MAG: phosphopyruvate hydratase [Candidatus Firestonebacteria bacterium]|nr:phosphopyruvate hydratase [Candidatus Firestonebacteria bacterium]
MESKIIKIQACEILSTAGFPTIETTVILKNGVKAKASVPFGSSAGKYEALTLVDKDPKRYNGFGMLKAVQNVEKEIAPQIVGMEVMEQKLIDEKLISMDPTPNRNRIGGNAILSVSLACARAGSITSGIPLYQYIRNIYGKKDTSYILPKPMMVVIEGGKHADNSTDLQEFKISIIPDWKARDTVRAGIEVYHTLGKILKEKGYNINVGYEGAYAPTSITTNEEPLFLIQEAIKRAGYKAGQEVAISLDPAASEFHDNGFYNLEREKKKLSSNEMIFYYKQLVEKYPINSIEDGLGEDDWESWPVLNRTLGNKIMIIGDDLTVTQVKYLQKAIDLGAINSILIKPNQVGTLSETIAAIDLAQKHNLKIVVSHRGGGETEDTFIIDLAVAVNAQFVKVGPSRGERVVKYNRLMEIGEELNR